MRIVSLTAENVKRLRAVHIEPDGDVVVIAGANAQGKTSVLDAIWLALGGGAASKSTPVPIREGEDHASVTLDLGDLKVTRTWTGDKTSLKVESADGARYGSPQSMLDSLVGRLSFDPLTFAQQDEKSQRTTLLSLVELPFDPDDLDARRRGAFEERTEVNRRHRDLRAQAMGLPDPDDDLPAEEVSVADLLQKAQDARQWQDRAAQIRTKHDAAVEKMRATKAALAEAEAHLLEVSNELAHIPGDLPDPSQYDQQLRDVEDTNRKVRAAAERQRLLDLAGQEEQAAGELTRFLADVDQQRADGLAAAVMPLDGLGFDDSGVTYQGVPLKQASAAEQLRVSIAMAMALNPKVRVIRITDGSLLDSHNLALIAEMAAAQDFQVWIEKVDESGEVGIVIEDGEVLNPSAAPTALAVVQ
jgi:hypothetical protein